jgi:hypothetical protein
MQNVHSHYGQRGFGALVRRGDGAASFLLQCRVVDKGEESRLKGPDDLPMLLVSEMALRFCPWCGVDLQKYYKKQIDLFPLRESVLSTVLGQ